MGKSIRLLKNSITIKLRYQVRFIFDADEESYKLNGKFTTKLNESKDQVEQTYNGKKDVLELDELAYSSYGVELNNFSGSEIDLTGFTGDEKWIKDSTKKSSNKILKFTVGAIAILISAITKIPATARVIINIANLAF